jgi:signal transduction histidine kinase
LSIVKKMVEAMNGQVWCESEPGRGALFVVQLPSQTLEEQFLSPSVRKAFPERFL